mmetsp:Transcript_34449/g.48091  ORF Transcript_34449/g.48091 Transcript_34449/m.48091 type:complete len:384 (+) Transcript_34449:1046-2197(+)
MIQIRNNTELRIVDVKKLLDDELTDLMLKEAEAVGERIYKPKVRYHFLHMTSNPLIDEQGQAVQRLNVGREWNVVKDALSRSEKALHVATMHATTINFREAITEGCKVLHYAGHGQKSNLVFEDSTGVARLLKVKALRDLFAVGNSCRTVDLVFVAACHSEVSGNAFVRAGVKHVIAVQVDETLEDHAAVTFTKQFYLAVTNDHTIKEAFDIAKVVVKETSKMGRKESEKFLLLPKDEKHDVKIFSSVTKGDLVDHTLLLPPHNLPSLSPQFVGRNQEMQSTIKFIRDARTRIVTITGKLGIGKAETATAVCRYMLQRNHFSDGMVMLDMANPTSDGTIFSQIAQVVGLNAEVKTSTKDNKKLLKSLEKMNILVIFTRIDEVM